MLTFGLLLITMLPLLVYLLLFGLFSAIIFSVYGWRLMGRRHRYRSSCLTLEIVKDDIFDDIENVKEGVQRVLKRGQKN